MALNELALKLEISSAYWSRIERDRENPPKDSLIQGAADALGEQSDEAFIAAGRLPPDLRVHIREIVEMYREKELNADSQIQRERNSC